MKRLSRDQHTTTLDRAVAPRLVVDSGEEVEVETWDAFMGVWDVGGTREIVGPMAGPIAVRGAAPGDALKIDLLDISPIDVAPGRAALHSRNNATFRFRSFEFKAEIRTRTRNPRDP